MALRYTGRANPLVVNGQAYKPGDIVPISKAQALRMAQRSRLHAFEDVPEPPSSPKSGKAAD